MVTWYIVAVVAVILWLGPAYLAAWAKASVSFTFKTTGKRTLFVHLAGLNGDGMTQIANIISTFLTRGSLLAVHYEGDLGKNAGQFDPQLVIDKTTKEVVSYARSGGFESIVFIGTSMGAKLAYQIAWRLKEDHDIGSKASIIDPPLKRGDFQPPLDIFAPVMRALLYIPLFNLLLFPPLSHIFMKVLVKPPKKDNIESTLTLQERRALDKSIVQAKRTKPTFYRGQVATIMRRMPPQGSPWGQGDVVYLRSSNDKDTVRPSAYDGWSRLLGFEPHFILVHGAKHCAYGENPTPYRRYLPDAFDFLGV